MDVTPFLELKIAPRAVFDRISTLGTRPRFMVRAAGGDWRAVTWNAFARQVRDVALFLATEIRSGERAAILGPNSVEWLAAALATQATGGVMVPIYPSSTAEQASYIASHSDARALFVGTEPLLARVLEAWSQYEDVRRIVLLSDEIQPLRAVETLRNAGGASPPIVEIERKVVTWSKACAMGGARDREDPSAFERAMNAVALDQPAVMLYTSGTSGPPKGVPLTHRNLGANGSDWLRANGPLLDEGAIDLLWLPMSHIFGFGEACIGNALGWTSYLADAPSVPALLSEVRPDVLMAVPALWEKLSTLAGGEVARLPEVTGGRLRFCLSGGAGLKREVKELFHAAGVLVVEGYGLTECSPTLTLNRPDAFRFDSVGKPVASVQLMLAEDGEILARGPNVFAGYHKDPAATAEAFTREGWFRTGDIGRFTEDGFLQIVDRKKDILVTSGGKNVAPANIELRFRDEPFLAHVVVYGDAKKYLVAGVWLHEAAVDAFLAERGADNAAKDEATRALVQQRIDRVNAEVASFETIKKFAVIRTPLTLEAGFLTPTLKVRRKKVYEAFASIFDELYA